MAARGRQSGFVPHEAACQKGFYPLEASESIPMGKMERSGRRDVKNRWYLPATAILLLATVATRFYRLSEWSFAGDELYTLRDSISPQLIESSKPLLFWLNHFLISPTIGFDEFGLRLLPALFGVAGVLGVIEVGRRISTDVVGVVAGALTLLSPWHLFWSQNARYYTLVFLFAAVAAGGLYIGATKGRPRWTFAGLLSLTAGYLAHPTVLLPVAGVATWYIIRTVAKDRVQLSGMRIGLFALLLVAAGYFGVRVLSNWTDLGQTWGIGGLNLMASYAIRLGPAVSLAAIGGLVLLWFDGQRDLCGFLGAAIGVPIIVLGILGKFVSVHTGYLFASAPFVFLAAGIFVHFVGKGARTGVMRSTVLLGVGLAVAASGIPSFVSHYQNGGRPNFEQASSYIASRIARADIVVTDQPGTLSHYTRDADIRALSRDPAVLDSLHSSIRSEGGALWLLPYYRSVGGFRILGLGRAEGWVREHCSLSRRIGDVRIDHQRSYVYIWRCPGEEPPAGDRGPTLGLDEMNRPGYIGAPMV